MVLEIGCQELNKDQIFIFFIVPEAKLTVEKFFLKDAIL